MPNTGINGTDQAGARFWLVMFSRKAYLFCISMFFRCFSDSAHLFNLSVVQHHRPPSLLFLVFASVYTQPTIANDFWGCTECLVVEMTTSQEMEDPGLEIKPHVK